MVLWRDGATEGRTNTNRMVRIWVTGKTNQMINEHKKPLPFSRDVLSLSVRCEAHWIHGTGRVISLKMERKEYNEKGFDKKTKTSFPQNIITQNNSVFKQISYVSYLSKIIWVFIRDFILRCFHSDPWKFSQCALQDRTWFRFRHKHLM